MEWSKMNAIDDQLVCAAISCMMYNIPYLEKSIWTFILTIMKQSSFGRNMIHTHEVGYYKVHELYTI